MVSFGTAGHAGRHQLLCTSSPESDCRVDCVQMEGRYRAGVSNGQSVNCIAARLNSKEVSSK